MRTEPRSGALPGLECAAQAVRRRAGQHPYNSILGSDEAWLTCRITWVEVWRNLGRRLTAADASAARDAFQADWARLGVVEIDAVLAEEAGRLADLTGARSPDALHLAAVQRTGPTGSPW